MIRRMLLALASAGVLATAALAADQVKVTADKFVVENATQSATFTGNVVVTRTGLTMWAPKMVVAYGDSGQSTVKSVTASGGVRIKTAEQDATGDRAIYDPGTQVLKLVGNVKVTSASGTLTGPELVIDLKTNVTTFSGSSTGRVTGVFTPDGQ